MSDKLVVMNAGNIEQIGTPAEVYRRPETRFVATFIGSPPMNILSGVVEGPGLVSVGGHAASRRGYARGAEGGRRRSQVGIRPEDVRVTADGDTAFRIDVDFIEELGATQLFHGRIGPDEFVLQAATGLIPAGSKQLALAVDPVNVHLFDPGTGQRLGRS